MERRTYIKAAAGSPFAGVGQLANASRSDARFAQTYWPWILLSQRQPLPESYLPGPRKRSFITPSDRVLSALRFSKNTFPPIATQRTFMESGRSIVSQPPSMSNTIAVTRGLPSKSRPRVVRSTLSMQKTAVRWECGVNGSPRGDRRGKVTTFSRKRTRDTAVFIHQFLAT